MRLLLAFPLLAALAPAPAFAQDRDRMNLVIVYGNDACPKSSGDEITVCARKDEGERYRIPPALRDTPSRQDKAWNNRVIAYEHVGDTGTSSCSAVGAGGWTGCMPQLIHDAYAEKKASSDVQFSRLVDQARQQRLSTIDATAAQTQAQVEAAEKDYEARQLKAAADSTEAPTNPPAAGVVTGSGGK